MSTFNKNPDVFGSAIFDFFHGNRPENILVHAEDFDDDEIAVDYLFRDFHEMPALEKTALNRCHGRTLDVGCGAGSHSIYLQHERKLEVVSIDISKKAIEICKLRGLKNARMEDFFQLKNEKFDTVLLLMNGSGIIGKLEHLERFFQQLRDLLAPNGRVLMDSSDLAYLFDSTEDGGIWIPSSEGYYGELRYRIRYKDEISNPFDWLFIDFQTLKSAAEMNGFQCKLIQKGEHFDYLAELSIL